MRFQVNAVDDGKFVFGG